MLLIIIVTRIRLEEVSSLDELSILFDAPIKENILVKYWY